MLGVRRRRWGRVLRGLRSPNTTSAIGRALVFNNHVPTVGNNKPAEVGVQHIVWGAQDNTLNPPFNKSASGVIHLYYMMWMRDIAIATGVTAPATTTPSAAFSWHRNNHPDWIVYQPDRATRAYYSNSSHLEPVLDFTNTAALTWFYNAYVKPALQNGFDGICIDNNACGNNWNAAGVYKTATGTVVSASGTNLVVSNATGLAANGYIAFGTDSNMEFKRIGSGYTTGTTIPLTTAVANVHSSGEWVGTWNQLYDPTNNGFDDDPLFAQAQAPALNRLVAMTRFDFPTALYCLNQQYVKVTDWPLASFTGIDLLLDEAGYTNWGDHGTSPDIEYITTSNVGVGSRHSTNLWLDMTNAYVTFQRDQGKGLILVNAAPYKIEASMTATGITDNDSTYGASIPASQAKADFQWILANYLLVRYHATYFWWGNNSAYGGSGQYGFDTGAQAEMATAAAIGTATNDFYASQSVYMRDFTNGRVIVNPSLSSTFSVTIPASTYKDLYGTTQGTTLSMGPHTGIVLLHV